MIPTPFSVTIHVRGVTLDTNEYGEPTYAWDDKVVPVHGYSPGAFVDNPDPTREDSEVRWTIYAPAGTYVPSSVDEVTIPILGRFPIIGTPADWTKGPWANPAAGVVIEVGEVGKVEE